KEGALDEAIIKELTGGDIISARLLYCEFEEFKPIFKLWLATNHLPSIRGTDHAIWRRIRVIPSGASSQVRIVIPSWLKRSGANLAEYLTGPSRVVWTGSV